MAERKFRWVAVCRYPEKKDFCFYSPTFAVEHWSDLEKVAAEIVAAAWNEISPYPAPPVVDYIPGYLEYVKEEL